jgi:hypothetical protein
MHCLDYPNIDTFSTLKGVFANSLCYVALDARVSAQQVKESPLALFFSMVP